MGEISLLIKNAIVADGTGKPGFPGSVAVTGQRISAVGDVHGLARSTIDAKGRVVCPGFVDAHSHADSSILVCPTADNLVMQGITTFVGGNCGQSLAPVAGRDAAERMLAEWGVEIAADWRSFGQWLGAVESQGLSVNYAPLVGHNTVREAVMADDFKRPATADETAAMGNLVRDAMESGAFGLSAGLDAAWAGHFAQPPELVSLAGVAREFGGFFAPHTRHHQNQWPAADPADFGYGLFHGPAGEIIVGRYHGLLEAVEIAQQSGGVRLQIAHLTPAYIIPQPHPSFLDEAAARATLVDIIDRAFAEGIDVTFSVIPWHQSVGRRARIAESFVAPGPFVPEWLTRLSAEALSSQLGDPGFRAQVREVVFSGRFKFRMIHPLTDPYWMDCYTILECSIPGYSGRTIGDIAREREPKSILRAVYHASLETLFDILVADPGATWALTVDKREFGALATFLRHPAAMPCSDVQAYSGAGTGTDTLFGYGGAPTAYGLFPHYLREFVRDTGALTLEEAIMKATSVPARRLLHLSDRGTIEAGAFADLVVLDPATVSEAGGFLDPTAPPVGIDHVIVNGTPVWSQGGHTGARPGMVLRRE
jgi:N-acyl-D-aspartate/D-glutamate deacylase